MKKIKMIFSDLDNTLLTNQKDISDYTLDIIERCRENNIKFIPATARPMRTLKRMGLLDMFPYDALLCFNGSRIYYNNKLIYHTGLSKENLDLFLPKLLENFSDCRISIEINDTVYVNHNIWEVDQNEKNYIITKDFKNLPNMICERIIVELKDLNDLVKLKAILPDYLYAHNIEGSKVCRVLDKSVSKANAIDYLCHQWNISKDEIVVFGDDFNDMEMFNYCTNKVAMSNAIDELKEIATDITLSNNEDGVAFWLDQNIIKKL